MSSFTLGSPESEYDGGGTSPVVLHRRGSVDGDGSSVSTESSKKRDSLEGWGLLHFWE